MFEAPIDTASHMRDMGRNYPEFDYASAWREARPLWDALPQSMRDLFASVRALAADIRQDKRLDLPWPKDDSLRVAFVPPPRIARSSRALLRTARTGSLSSTPIRACARAPVSLRAVASRVRRRNSKRFAPSSASRPLRRRARRTSTLNRTTGARPRRGGPSNYATAKPLSRCLSGKAPRTRSPRPRRT